MSLSGGVARGRIRALDACDVCHPGQGEVLEVITGSVLVFVEDASGRRIPVTSIEAGGVVVGCDSPAAVGRLLATGLPGTQVRIVAIGESTGTTAMAAWAAKLSAAVSAGRWPRRLLAVSDAGAMVSPGETIGGSLEPVEWVWVAGGTATLCSWSDALIGTLDPPFPLVRGAWLTAGLRARFTTAPVPTSAREWSESLDLLGRLSVLALNQSRVQRDQECVDRLSRRTAQADAAAQAGVDVLTAAVGGVQRIPAISDKQRSAELAAAAEVARASGLLVTDDALTRAAADVESGRDATTALAAAVSARVRSVRLDRTWWQHEGTALLVGVVSDRGGRRPGVALWRHGWVLRDPATNQEVRVTAEVAAGVDRQAEMLLPILPGRPASLGDLGRLALRGSRRELVVVVAVTAGLAAMSFLTPFLMGQLASLFTATSPRSAYIGLFGALLLVVAAGTAWQAVRALAMLRARSQAAAISSGALWERVIRQRATWHAQRTLGDRFVAASAINNASASLPDETLARLLDTAAVIGALAAIATANVTMLWCLGALLAVQLVVTLGLLAAAARSAGARLEASAVANGRLMEILGAVNRLRVAGAGSRAFLRWAQAQAPYARADQSLRRILMAQGVVIAVWPALSLAVVVAVTAGTGASFGEFVTAQTASSIATMAVAAMALSANGALIARQSLRRASGVLADVPEGGAAGAQPGVIQGGLEVANIVFRYGSEGPVVLDHVSLSIRPGEHVAIVGPSGCGKTTLMRIILGLEDPESGVISVDGRDLAALDRPAVRRQVGSVLQSSTLLPASIRENVEMGRSMTADQVWAALDAAAIGADVRALAMGLDTPVPDGGGTLSGGQRQRMLIARALAGSPRMLMLDEATSALDNLSQAAVVEALESLRITRIVVAHRLSTIRHADRIIVMSAGRIVEEGSFEELMARPGAFQELAHRQLA